MRILVTGGAGFIGSHTCVSLLEKGYEIVILDSYINSHEKSYKLCWILNKELHKNFVKVKDHTGPKKNGFQRYSHRKKLGEIKYDVISNRSENGCLLNQYKTIDYFLVIEPSTNKEEKIIKSLNKIKEILFVFQLDLSKTKAAFEFILND